MKLVGANRSAKVTALDELSGKVNYFAGNDPKKWRTGVPTYASVKYEGVYPGVDLIYYGNREEPEYFEFDFVVAPGADPREITISLETENPKFEIRNSKLQIDSKGDLVIQAGVGLIRFRKPRAYQPKTFAGNSANSQFTIHDSEFVDCRYVLASTNSIKFEVRKYDPRRPLVIDPVLSYSTYLGGSGADDAWGVAVDAAGSTYLIGQTNSRDFPASNAAGLPSGTCSDSSVTFPCSDVFVIKLNASGTGIVYSTYLGGAADDRGSGIAVDSAGNAYVTGMTTSGDFPVLKAFRNSYAGGNCGGTTFVACFDAFVVKLSPAGAIVYSTYLGGSKDDFGETIAVDSQGRAFVAGSTSSTDFPVTAGALRTSPAGGSWDAFVTAFKPEGSAPEFSSYLGGSGEDHATGITLDSAGRAYVAGYTASSDFPIAGSYGRPFAGGTCSAADGGTAPCTDAFLTHFNFSGSALIYSNFLGGSGGDYARGVAVDAAGAAYVAGYTSSSDFPATPGVFQQHGGEGTLSAFVSKFDAAGGSLVYSTYFGGVNPAAAYGLAVDSLGQAFITGYAFGPGLPLAAPIQSANASFDDAFLAKLDPAGSALIFSSYWGGGGDERARAIALDAAGNATIAGTTFSEDFPVMNALQPSYTGGSFDAFVARFSGLTLPVASVVPASLTFSGQGVQTTSLPLSVTLDNPGDAPLVLTGVSTTGDFSQTNDCGTALAPRAYCTVKVTFRPKDYGPRFGELSLADDAWTSPQRVPLAGNGVPSAIVSLSPASLTFGSQLVGTTSSAQTITFSNGGSVTLALSSIAADGDFTQTSNCPASILAGGQCSIQVTFRPTAAGTRAGVLTIADDAPGSPHWVTLSGTGTQPVMSLSTSGLTFADQGVGTASAPQAVAVSNLGTAPLEIDGISVGGDFEAANNCSSAVAPGGSCSIQVRFRPTVLAPRAGTLEISHNASGSPSTVSLAGQGVLAFALSSSRPEQYVLHGTPTASFSIAASSAYGFGEQIALACAGLSGVTCEFAPPSIVVGVGSTLTLGGTSNLGAGEYAFSVAGTNGAQTAALPLTLAIGDFWIKASPDAGTIKAGESASFNLELGPLGGFSQTAGLVCRGAPPAGTCSITPSALTPDGVHSVVATMVITTTARSLAPVPPTPRENWWVEVALACWSVLQITIASGMSLAGDSRQRPSPVAVAMVGVLLAAVVIATNCGGGGGGSPYQPPPTGTPAGNYSLVVNATSGSLSHEITATLKVN